MSSENWKIEKDLCRCCHTEGTFKNLAEPCVNAGITEIYVDMLKECYDIDMSPIPGLLCAATYTICEVCIIRLRHASEFKNQVLTCEQRFRDMYNKNLIKAAETTIGDINIEVDVKEEPDTYQDDDSKEEFPQDDNGDEVYDESLDIKQSEQEEEPEKDDSRSSKKRKLKSKKTEKNKRCRRTERKKIHQGTQESSDAVKKSGPTYYTVIENEYLCNICGKKYSSQPLVSQHYRFVHLKRRPKDRKCPKCDERIPDYLRTAHLEKEHGIPAPSCGVCGKKFRFPCNVIQHQKKVHMGEKTVVCDICQKCFFNKLSLRLHMSTHSDEKRFKCETCDRGFRWENNLKDHVRIHTGDKRFICPVCDKAFVQKSTLKQHAARNHPGVDIS